MFLGNQVKDANGLSAVFAELGSSSSLMSASTVLVVFAMLPGCAGEQSDTEEAGPFGARSNKSSGNLGSAPRGPLAQGVAR